MRTLALLVSAFLLTSCAPRAWTQAGFSLEQGDAAFASCKSQGDANIPQISIFDVDVNANITNAYYDSFMVQNALERHLENEAQQFLQDYRRDAIHTFARNCMIQNGWLEIDDPR